uniref:Protein longifolia 1-like n=1 Tax=Tanacetum cinerariifolium TaxID=118510 RepID=A0A699HMX0_TANCI|nr:protein longifolia 1-like [Tanacetum cinerariifolium]
MMSFLTYSACVSSKINRKKLQTIKHLVQKLIRLNSTHDEGHTDYIASLCENTKTDDSFSGTFTRNFFKQVFKAHEQDIIRAKAFKGSMYRDRRATTSEEEKEDVSLDQENDGLKTILWEEVLNRAESWTDYDGELPVIALEVERLIFEGLVNEVVLGEASHDKRIQPGRCRRRLSSK